jgi:hypothetical protein
MEASERDGVRGRLTGDLPKMENDKILCDYIPCPTKDCSAIVVPGASEKNRYDGQSRTWHLQCPRCQHQFQIAKSELKKESISLRRIREDYPTF